MTSISSSDDGNPAVEALVNFADDIFERHFVMSLQTRRQVITAILDRGKIFEQLDHSYDITSFLAGHSTGAIVDPSAMKRNVVTVTAGLKPSQQADLSRWNPDLEIKFVNSVSESHSVAYAQRIIDTERCKSLLHLKNAPIMDLGGNWFTHLMREHRFVIHSCNLVGSQFEAHRQAQRHALAELRDMSAGGDLFCTAGAENCDFQASEGISIHVLPEIDPDSIPLIFKKHGLNFMVGVHHYDSEIEVAQSGVIHEMNMQWQCDADQNIVFRFQGEGSHPYTHRRDWLLEYARCWVRTLPDWDYVVYYAVDYIRHGILKWTMVRMLKDSLGAQHVRPQFRFLEHPGTVELLVPVFDAASGYSDKAPQAYHKPRVVQVPQAMFAEVYRIGVSNETSRPDKPLTLDDIRNEVHNFNTVRYLSGTLLTIPTRLDTDIVNDIALGMYLLIVRRAAQNAVTYGHFVKQMKIVQGKWAGTTMIDLLARATTEYMVWPLLSPITTTFSESVAAMAMFMRKSIRDTYTLAHASEFIPYRVLPPIRPIVDGGDKGIWPGDFNGSDGEDPKADFQQEITAEEFLDIFGSQMPEEYRKAAHEAIARQVQENASIADTLHPVTPAQLRDGCLVDYKDLGVDPNFDDFREARRELSEALESSDAKYHVMDVEGFQGALSNESMDAAKRTSFMKPRLGTDQQVNAYTRERIYEYGLYCTDVGMNVLGDLRQGIQRTWSGGTFNKQNLVIENNLYDRGLLYLDVQEGIVKGAEEGEYKACMDPVSRKFQYIRDGGHIGGEVAADKVAVNDEMRIFNSLIIGRSAVQYAKTGRVKDVKITLVDGVFGSGKTYTIINSFNPRDLICCAVRDTADETRNELAHRFLKDGTMTASQVDDFCRQRVRTVDSANMHNLPTVVDVVYIDEGLMAFPGAILLILMKCGAREARIFGDVAQIGAIERGSSAGSLYFSAFFFYTSIVEDNISKRSPADVVCLLAQYYPESRRERLKTLNPIKRSMSAVYESDIKAQFFTRANPSSAYLSVLQADKHKLMHAGTTGFINGKLFKSEGLNLYTSDKRPVYSTHEAQGRTFPDVIVVRMNTQTVGTFDSSPHMVVNMSRHTVRMRYVSLAPEGSDPLSRSISRLRDISDEVLESFMEETPEWLEEKIQKQKIFVEDRSLF